jgi:FkbM family methyltransferase
MAEERCPRCGTEAHEGHCPGRAGLDSLITVAEAEFTDRLINQRYTVKMPRFLALQDAWDNWERERFSSMESLLHKGDILLDVGAETGAISAVYAQFVGGENMCLVESNPDNWQNIRATWEQNRLRTPRATLCALVGNKVVDLQDADFDRSYVGPWPKVACTGKIWTPRSFRYLHEHAATTPQITIDRFVHHTQAVPRAITIDCEGAELQILEGALNTLSFHRPLVWCSIHPELMARDYGSTPEDVLSLMEAFGYTHTHLATDHEDHHLFSPKSTSP